MKYVLLILIGLPVLFILNTVSAFLALFLKEKLNKEK